MTPATLQEVVDYGIQTVLDLRKPDEVAESPNPLPVFRPGLSYHNISLVDFARPRIEFPTLAQDYKDGLISFSGQIGQILKAAANAGDGGILIHCAGGKDRTGLISALLLRIAGVSISIAAEDYALSEKREWNWLENGPGTRDEREKAYQRLAPRASVMTEVLQDIERDCGGLEGYLAMAGVGEGDVERIRFRLVG